GPLRVRHGGRRIRRAAPGDRIPGPRGGQARRAALPRGVAVPLRPPPGSGAGGAVPRAAPRLPRRCHAGVPRAVGGVTMDAAATADALRFTYSGDELDAL